MLKYVCLLIAIASFNAQAMERQTISFSECQVKCPPYALDREDAMQYIKTRIPKPIAVDFIRNFPRQAASLEIALPTIKDENDAILVKTLISNYPQLAEQGITLIHIISRDLPCDLATYKYVFFVERILVLQEQYKRSSFPITNARAWSHDVLQEIFNNIRFISIEIPEEKLDELVVAYAPANTNAPVVEIKLEENMPLITQIIEQCRGVQNNK